MTIARDQLAVPAVSLAPRLLGAILASGFGAHEVVVRLTEVEAYEGLDDPASHAYRGPTPRNAVMFGAAGHLYVYFTYGMHWCANIVCGPPGRASAVLLRGGEVVGGIDVARRRRPAARSTAELARGPARLAACLALSRENNGIDVCDAASAVRLESLSTHVAPNVRSGPRVGIMTAADRPWRFWLDGDLTVSPYRTGQQRRRAAANRQTDAS
jgi:DNA-3-methyladenine glycosylase